MGTKRMGLLGNCIKKIACCVFSIILVISATRFDVYAIGVNYDIKAKIIEKFERAPLDDEWRYMKVSERWTYYEISREEIEMLSTKDLAECALHYPLLSDVIIFDTPKLAMDYFIRTAPLFEILFNRCDVITVFLGEYEGLTKRNYINMRGVSNETVDMPIEMLFRLEFLNSFFECYCGEMTNKEKRQLSNYVLMGSNDGFSSSGRLYDLNGGKYYLGCYNKYGVSANCYKYYSGDMKKTEKDVYYNDMKKRHPSWTYKSEATIKYNCHSYAWIEKSVSNVYWLDTPNTFANQFTHVNSNKEAKKGDIIVIIDSNGNPTHSLVVTKGGKDCNSIVTISKCGKAGLYSAILADMCEDYGGSYEVYR